MLLNIEKFKFWEWKGKYRKTLNKLAIAQKTQVILSFIPGAIDFLIQLAIYWIGAYLTFEQELTIGQYVAFISIFGMVKGAINSVLSLWFMVTDMTVTYNKLNDVYMQEKEDINILEQHTEIKQPVIELKDVSFSYDKNKKINVLTDISLSCYEKDSSTFILSNYLIIKKLINS